MHSATLFCKWWSYGDAIVVSFSYTCCTYGYKNNDCIQNNAQNVLACNLVTRRTLSDPLQLHGEQWLWCWDYLQSVVVNIHFLIEVDDLGCVYTCNVSSKESIRCISPSAASASLLPYWNSPCLHNCDCMHDKQKEVLHVLLIRIRFCWRTSHCLHSRALLRLLVHHAISHTLGLFW